MRIKPFQATAKSGPRLNGSALCGQVETITPYRTIGLKTTQSTAA